MATFVQKPAEVEKKWILIDAGEVIAHVFVEQDRQYYDLENLWCDAPRIAYEGE